MRNFGNPDGDAGISPDQYTAANVAMELLIQEHEKQLL